MKAKIIKLILGILLLSSCSNYEFNRYSPEDFPIKVTMASIERDKDLLIKAIELHNQELGFDLFEFVDGNSDSNIYVYYEPNYTPTVYVVLFTHKDSIVDERHIILDDNELAESNIICNFAQKLALVAGYPVDLEETKSLMSQDIYCPIELDESDNLIISDDSFYQTFSEWFEDTYPSIF